MCAAQRKRKAAKEAGSRVAHDAAMVGQWELVKCAANAGECIPVLRLQEALADPTQPRATLLT
jgi:hypothetical protein